MSAGFDRSRLTKNAGFVGSIVGGLSVVNLISSGFQLGWTAPFRKILEQYFVITNNLRGVVEPIVVPTFRLLAEAFDLHFSFGPHWTDILLLMMVYLGSRLKAYASDGKRVRAVAMLIISVAISIASSFFGSSMNLFSWTDAFQASAVPLLGFLTYDILYACVGAAFDRRGGVTWLHDFVRHLRFSVPLILICSCVNLLLTSSLVSKFNTTGHQAFIFAFLVNYVLISAYWAFKSLQHARKRENRRLGESVRERYRRSSATTVAVNVAIVVISAALFVLSNAGLKVAGAEYLQLH